MSLYLLHIQLLTLCCANVEQILSIELNYWSIITSGHTEKFGLLYIPSCIIVIAKWLTEGVFTFTRFIYNCITDCKHWEVNWIYQHYKWQRWNWVCCSGVLDNIQYCKMKMACFCLPFNTFIISYVPFPLM